MLLRLLQQASLPAALLIPKKFKGSVAEFYLTVSALAKISRALQVWN